MPVHGIDNGNNKKDVYTTEEVLSILQQAIDSGTLQGIDPDETPIVAAVRESHNNSDVTFWSGTEAEFNELTGVTSELVGARIGSDGKLYLLTGDTTLSDTVEAARQAALEATEGMKREVISVTLLANGWSNTAPYTQTVAVAGMTADKDFLAPYVVPTGNESDDIAAQVALSCISGGTTDTDSVTFYCYDEKPTTTITVFMVDKGTKLESSYPIASATNIGMVKVGDGLNVDQAGELSVAAYQIATYSFDNVAAMVAYNLAEGHTAITAGYYSVNDGGASTYKIVSSGATADGGSIIELSNGLKAQLIVENDTINVKQFGAKGDGTTDDTAAIQNALKYNENKPTIVKLIKGETYIVDGNIYIYSNTTLDLNNAVIKDAPGAPSTTSYNKVQFMNNVASMTAPGYGAIKNFVVKNGTLNGNAGGVSFLLFHGQDCRFENIDFLNAFVSTHVFDLGGCKNITVKNCNFIGNLLTTAANNYREVIQPDYATLTALPYWGDDESFAFDALPTDGLVVDGCLFKKNDSDTYYLNGVGTHSIGTEPHNNIVVKNCEFYGCEFSNIRLPKANNVLVENNIFYSLRSGRTGDNYAINIYHSTTATDAALENVVIKDNKYIATLERDDQIFLGIKGNASYIRKNIKIIGNEYNGAAVSEDGYQGQDFSQLFNLDGVLIENNIIRKAKAIAYKSSGSVLENARCVNNICENCLRGIRGADSISSTDSKVYPESFAFDNNVWKNPLGTVNTSSARIVLGLEQDFELTNTSDTVTKLPLKVLEGLDLFFDNNDFTVPAYFKRFKLTGYLNVQTGSTGVLNLTRIYNYDRAFSTSKTTDIYHRLSAASSSKSVSIGKEIVEDESLVWHTSSDTARAWRNGRFSLSVRVGTSGDSVKVLAAETKIILEAF